MANHVYYNVEVEGLTEEQFNCLWKTEEVKYVDYNDEERTRLDLIDLHNQPFMLKIDRKEDEDGWIQDSYNWYCNNICLLYTSPSPRDKRQSRMPSSA